VTEPSWWLTPLGYLPWAQVLAELQGLTCTWADYTGLHETDHLERLRTAPPYSHVWGWSDDRLVRVRVDVDEGVVAVLTRVDLARAATGPVRVIERTAVPFSPDRPLTRLIQVLGPTPLVFVAGPASGGPAKGTER
jgi:hypothetical protein